MEVFFCDRCSSRVTEGDLSEGRAFQIHTFVLCKTCWDNSEVREAIQRKVAEAGVDPRQTPLPGRRTPSGRHTARRKTPRPASGIRRTPSRGTPRRSPPRGTPRRTPVPHGRRRTPGRTSSVRLESVQPHVQSSRHEPRPRNADALPKAAAFAGVGLVVGLLAIFFLGGKKPRPVAPAAADRADGANTSVQAAVKGAANARDGKGGGDAGADDDGSDIQDMLYRDAARVSGLVPGLHYDLFLGSWGNLPSFDGMSSVETGTVSNFRKVGSPENDFGIRFTGYVDAPVDGRYFFHVNSDDGSRLWVDGMPVVDNDGTHGPQERTGTAYLRAGKHRVKLDFFQGGSGYFLAVDWTRPGGQKGSVPDSSLFHRER